MKSVVTTFAQWNASWSSTTEATRNTRILYALAISFACSYSFWADVRPFASGPRFIGHGDQAEVASVARNIAEGNGALTDCVWLLHAGGRPTDEVKQPIGYWSLYLAALLSIPFKVFGASRLVLLATGSATKILAALIASHMTLNFTRDYRASFTCLLWILCMPYMCNRVNGYSDLWLASAILFCVSTLAFAATRNSVLLWFVAGLCGGLAVGFKHSGWIVVGLYTGSLIMPYRPSLKIGQRALSALAVIAGFTISLMPFAFHNYRIGGSVALPDQALVATAARTAKLSSSENYNTAMFSIDTPSTVPTHEHKLKLYGQNIHENIENLFSLPNTLLLLASPLLCFIFARLLHDTLARHSLIRDPETVFIYLTILLSLAGLLIATQVHYESRYWSFLIPPYAIICITFVFQRMKLLTYPLLLVGVFFALQAGRNSQWIVWSQEWDAQKMTCYKETSKYIPDASIVMTPDPWEFAFHTRLPSVVLPVTENEETIKSVAKRYGATYLVLVNGNHRHSYYDRFVSGDFPNFAIPVHVTDNLIITKIDFDE